MLSINTCWFDWWFLLFRSCENLSKSLPLSEPSFPHLYNKGIESDELWLFVRVSGGWEFQGAYTISILKRCDRSSLAIQWLRLHLPMLAVQVWSLVGERGSYMLRGAERKITLENLNAAAAAAKSLQSCPTLCDPIDGSPPGSPVPGIL